MLNMATNQNNLCTLPQFFATENLIKYQINRIINLGPNLAQPKYINNESHPLTNTTHVANHTASIILHWLQNPNRVWPHCTDFEFKLYKLTLRFSIALASDPNLKPNQNVSKMNNPKNKSITLTHYSIVQENSKPNQLRKQKNQELSLKRELHKSFLCFLAFWIL